LRSRALRRALSRGDVTHGVDAIGIESLAPSTWFPPLVRRDDLSRRKRDEPSRRKRDELWSGARFAI